MRSIMALDLGTTTGFAVFHNGKIVSGSKCFQPRSYEGAGMRYLRFRREFLDKLSTVSEVFYEDVVKHSKHDGTQAAHVYGGFKAVLMQWCEENTIPYRGINVMTIKKHWAGTGRANKLLMIKRCLELGYKPKDDNEADAIALLDYARFAA